MSRQLHMNQAAEREANEIAFRFMNSSDVVGDMSRAYGADLSSVRIHTDESAAQKVEGTGADAFSTGRDVFFGRGVFNRSDPASRGLLAHELAHSLQQGAGGGEPGMVTQSVPEGAAQGGRLMDWFRSHFTAKGRAERRAKQMTPEQIPNRMPEAAPGQLNPESFGAFEEALTAPGGAIEAANRSFAADSAEGAKVSLGLRENDRASTKAMKAFRGSLMDNYSGNVAEYMHNLENGGMDFAEVMAGAQTYSGGMGSYKTSDKMGQMGSDILSMFGQYVQSDQGLQFLQQTSDTVKQADVFGGNSQSALNFMLQSMILGANGPIYQSIQGQKDSYRKGTEAATVAASVTRLLQKLPVFAELDADAKAALPDSVKPLVTQYQTLVDQIRQQLGQ